jgi:nitric oxide reductase subunit C
MWLFLFLVFVGYTVLVYSYSDTQTTSGAVPDAKALAGWHTWQQKNCQTCHQIYGLGGYMGPDLTNTASDPAKGDLYMKTLIKYGTGRMPNFNLNDKETEELVAFLKWVDKSGRNAVPKEKVTWAGNYNIDK